MQWIQHPKPQLPTLCTDYRRRAVVLHTVLTIAVALVSIAAIMGVVHPPPGAHAATETPLAPAEASVYSARPNAASANGLAVAHTPDQIRGLLGLGPEDDGRGQTIAIVVAFDHPTIVEDVAVFSRRFRLPLPCAAKGAVRSDCFDLIKAMPQGQPSVDPEWARETALDVEWAHAIAPRASILLVEARTASIVDLMDAVTYAAKQPGVVVISNSWGGSDYESGLWYDSRCALKTAVCVFASGDHGRTSASPIPVPTVAHMPHALIVGGTRVTIQAEPTAADEAAWNLSGGGISWYTQTPSYQAGLDLEGGRGIPDVSFAADPMRGFWVYSSVFPGVRPNDRGQWLMMGGTSAGTPQWAALIAVADQHRAQPLSAVGFEVHTALYEHRGPALFDVIEGANGPCVSCVAGTGYDLVTGLGSPRAGILQVLVDAPSLSSR